MNNIVGVIVGLGAVLIGGLICSFFVILNAHKDEILEILEFEDEKNNAEDDK